VDHCNEINDGDRWIACMDAAERLQAY
jgi:hypothetical protein